MLQHPYWCFVETGRVNTTLNIDCTMASAGVAERTKNEARSVPPGRCAGVSSVPGDTVPFLLDTYNIYVVQASNRHATRTRNDAVST